MRKAIIAISGGIDSTTCAAIAKSRGYDLLFLTVNYGQKNFARELANTNYFADYYGASEHKVVEMRWLGNLGTSMITDSSINSLDKDELIYVPFRNPIILSAAIAWAEADTKIEKIFIGSEAGPWISPDNSHEFISEMNKIIKIATKNNKNLEIEAPLNYMDKPEIIKTALKYKVPLEHTYTCVTNPNKPCGICQPCRNRREAFESLGLVDPALKN